MDAFVTPDFLWAGRGVVLEYDSVKFHAARGATQLERDAVRANTLAALGIACSAPPRRRSGRSRAWRCSRASLLTRWVPSWSQRRRCRTFGDESSTSS